MGVKTMKKATAVKKGRKAMFAPMDTGTLGDRIDRAMELMTVRMAETDAKLAKELAKSRAETEAWLAKSRAETEAMLAEKLAKSKADTEAILAESGARIDKRLAQLSDSIEYTDKKYGDLNSRYGGLSRGFGQLVEFLVIPKIRPEMNRHGHKFSRSVANKVFRFIPDDPGRKIMVTEVDMFMYNGTEAMAVEIKTSLSVQDMEDHIRQLRMLRKHESSTEIHGKKLYGAVVGVFVDDSARRFAKRKGLYLLEIIEEENRMATTAPPNPHIW
ncbi:MAG: hypothetical protein LBB74_03760 [Chitinispirillales bacterium]|jgi:hypothetical protein|nr:hypothetical protein [Chitinispirillales bacterium]